ncbi:hypothetical protein SAMN05216403_106110 [Nitrosospira multiformis ATCC 25196]|uniref:Lipoprotein n=1 Tax=Nitrosospira multiformis (strain ATCC 25196 / NCIMB 11849 / C 71) TaxID=323848 RepID=Q2Y6W0_NITMU|nr:hypothetical protein [Nitrosospira multiformis]ABB75511.1 conserved hypothetical protein [Nitrosospira multiformis ATCC 25196]SEF70776.1 hypothetical protein SAMN05216403_106110 [Nitrosospira multiformis ATCC 25196]
MKNLLFQAASLTLVGAVSTACVTINIYFPAAAAEKAADKIIEEVWQLKKPEGGEKTGPVSPPPPSSQPAVEQQP